MEEKKTECCAANSDVMMAHIKHVKMCRVEFDRVIQMVRECPCGTSRETALSITNAQQAVMWLGMELKRLHDMGCGENPYPNSKDPSNTIIEPVADGLKM